ncbi:MULTISPECIES: type III secretion system export apparatus subunit SctU [Parachlamydia]|jgi:type III secretion YscU/HrpY family protein|uniref:Type III secretion integral inner membrane protein n=2 Tax=Parachlamydia acanthamoebae TaxID=83552 RepID=F8KXZ4_PARAV|nr:type III secretion system export apparatus subunit SctU [Parachlamydia acanthamoebae]EFB40383.1 type III secretion inner membrane protein SctU [Parachlamydia acanthamoebae str. Hall's coccus]CCB85730.1 type III secretion integral inner membrane protein [Parachlamydia acanthamoebae UV-7]
MGEKTEKATPKKLRDARNKGQVAKSQDLPSAFTFIVSIWVTLAASKFLFDHLGSFTVMTFHQIAKGSLDTAIPDLYIQGLTEIFITSIPILGMVSVIGVLINFLVVGPMFALEVFKFDIKKFDPISNLKSKFKLKTLVELLKSVLKISIACYIVYDVMWKSLPVLIRAVSLPIDASLMVFYAFLMEVVIKVGLFFIIIAVADFIYQKKTFASEMKMEKFEVKQEYKNSEGDPQIKSKRKQIAQEIAYQEGPRGGVKRAQAVVTNPTHLAIAIGYKKDYDAAPFVLAKGEDALAERIIKYAEEFNVPVVRNIKLAHKLWEEADVYEFVPEDTYELIAEILRWISSLNTDTQHEYTER